MSDSSRTGYDDTLVRWSPAAPTSSGDNSERNTFGSTTETNSAGLSHHDRTAGYSTQYTPLGGRKASEIAPEAFARAREAALKLEAAKHSDSRLSVAEAQLELDRALSACTDAVIASTSD